MKTLIFLFAELLFSSAIAYTAPTKTDQTHETQTEIIGNHAVFFDDYCISHTHIMLSPGIEQAAEIGLLEQYSYTAGEHQQIGRYNSYNTRRYSEAYGSINTRHVETGRSGPAGIEIGKRLCFNNSFDQGWCFISELYLQGIGAPGENPGNDNSKFYTESTAIPFGEALSENQRVKKPQNQLHPNAYLDSKTAYTLRQGVPVYRSYRSNRRILPIKG